MQELLWVLLPVAAASGWWAAKRSMAKGCEEADRLTTPAYFRGLNYLLNEEPDKAIDVFVQLLEVDSETVETHLALGSLFRRRGEVERAIRIHQNLIARPALPQEQRAQALLELGMDYMRAGLYDRAENLFLELKEMKLHVRKALENLLIVYQQEKDWQSCLKTAEELAPLIDEPLSLERSHFYCELAEEALRKGNTDSAGKLLKKAASVDTHSVRPMHMQAHMAMAQADCKSAIRLLRQAVEKDAYYLPEVLPDLMECYRRLSDLPALRVYLQDFLGNGMDVAVALAITEIITETEDETAARGFLSKEMHLHPTLKGLLRLIELNASLPDIQAEQMLLSMKTHVEQLLAERPAYQCRKCGFMANTLHWQCPSCRSWGSIRRKSEPEEKQT
ncbi:MAG TPA: lipopolysaccharide assembly protein LapB [Thiolapillus brandeum]|uniref:Lipopolysaccharide assembly protein B n=1 Tax=Thiolapillus brandeum TaxID=1076588 RepID=A0A831WE60_9GAMM|nr:lipopolysaccharide assembly protein LapB [Thiolapillus brandeum]